MIANNPSVLLKTSPAYGNTQLIKDYWFDWGQLDYAVFHASVHMIHVNVTSWQHGSESDWLLLRFGTWMIKDYEWNDDKYRQIGCGVTDVPDMACLKLMFRTVEVMLCFWIHKQEYLNLGRLNASIFKGTIRLKLNHNHSVNEQNCPKALKLYV